MDYAFVPGLASGNGYLTTISSALQLHPNLAMLSPSPDTLSNFIEEVDIDDLAVPSEDLILGTHADDEGVILVSIDPATPSPITFEKLQAATTIKLPSELNNPGTSFRIIGCLIGSDNSLPLLSKLKDALGSPHAVVAPKYLYGVAPHMGGFLETMLYQFRILSPTPLASRDAVKQAFQAGSNSTPPQFVDVNGAKISTDKWDTWLPPEAQLQLAPATVHALRFAVNVSLPALSTSSFSVSTRANFPAYWIVTHETIFIDKIDTGQGIDSTKTPKELAQAGIPNDARYKSSHPYPYYRRYFYDSAQSLIDNVHWVAAAHVDDNIWQFTADRYRYEFFIPLTEPPTDDLICNYYSAGQPPLLSMFQGHSVDARLFASV